MAGGFKVSRKKALESLWGFLDKRDEVILAYVFGSVAEEGFSGHDVDLALKLESEDNVGVIAALTGEIARLLKIPEDRVDIVDIDKASLPLKHKILFHGVKLVSKKDAENKLIQYVVEN